MLNKKLRSKVEEKVHLGLNFITHSAKMKRYPTPPLHPSLANSDEEFPDIRFKSDRVS